MPKPKIVLDTNIILSSIFPTYPYELILRSVANEQYDMYVSTPILLEYEEKINDIFGIKTAQLFIDFCKKTPNIKNTEIYYNWRMIYADPDDDKFVDCAIAANANFLVTNDKHFNILKGIVFPHLKVLKINDFMNFLSKDINPQ